MAETIRSYWDLVGRSGQGDSREIREIRGDSGQTDSVSEIDTVSRRKKGLGDQQVL
jgi:hypothetical protein